MSRPVEGLKSEALLVALKDALSGTPLRLEELLARHGGLPGPKPNLKLAAAFGIELGGMTGKVAQLLTRLGANDAAPDTAQAFLPVAAAHGWAQRIRENQDIEAGWRALMELAADERGPVRVGTIDALITLSLREGGVDILITRAQEWLDEEDRELRFGAAALVIEALGDPRMLGSVRDHDALLTYLSSAIDRVADAPRSAERSEGRRRVLTSLALALASVVALVRAGDRGMQWFEAECTRAKHPDVRFALSQALLRLAKIPQAPSATLVDELRKNLADSAKPLRDPTLVRPGTGRGRRSRNTR
ncbi:MAG: hypothetical protein JWN04_4402 [Myxococcaceae bacterium]|nr:hypothetical protein [Myxococcaceae bacterium]